MLRTEHVQPPPFDPARPDLVAPVRVDRAGRKGPTRRQARGSGWRRTSRGLYVPSSTDADVVPQRIVEAAAVLPSYGGVTGWAALAWCGGRWFDGQSGDTRLPVDLVTSCDDIRSQPGIRVSAERIDPRELTVVDGLRMTHLPRAVLFLMRHARGVEEASRHLAMAAYSDLVSIEEAAAYAVQLSGWTGIPQARDALAICDENLWSPLEHTMLMFWTRRAGMPRPLCNVPVFDETGRHLGTPDLLDPVQGVAGEYNGSGHLEVAQHATDVRRESDFRSVGLEVVTMLRTDLPDPSAFVARLEQAYDRAALRPAVRRGWRLEPPGWWTDISTVAARRALTGEAREWLLRRRSG